MDADAIMVAIVMATNPNHRPSREQRAHNPSRVLDAWISTNGPAWSVNRFYLMVRRRGIKCVHLPDLFLSDGNMKERHQMCSPAVDPPCVGEDVQCFQTHLVNF